MRMATAGKLATVQGQVRVRGPHAVVSRAAIFAHLEANLPNCGVYWREDLGVTLSAGLVTTWADQSTSGNDVTAAGAARPTYDAARYNDRPALRFDGVANTLSRAATNLFGSGAYSMLLVLKVIAIAGNATFLGNGTGGAGVYFFTGAGNTRSLLHQGVEVHTDGALQTTSHESWISTRPAASAPTLRVNGIAVAVTNANPAVSDPGGAAELRVGAIGGASNFSNEDVLTAAMYTRDLSAAEQRLIGARAAARYAMNWE
jgi:hypothetical protein